MNAGAGAMMLAGMREGRDALFNTSVYLAVGQEEIEELKRRARQSPRGRYRLCLHHRPEDAIQEMLTVHCRGNYSRPHRHAHTANSYYMIEGELETLIFNDEGQVTERIRLGAHGQGAAMCLWIAAGCWHMPVCLSELAVFHEVIGGPFERDKTNEWAPWSPDEDDVAGIEAFMRTVGA